MMIDENPKKKNKKKKGEKKPVVEQPKEEVEDDGTHWKGKHSSFFEMKKKEGPSEDPQNPNNYDLTADQWSFMYLHYPEYSLCPFEMMVWLQTMAKADEDRKA